MKENGTLEDLFHGLEGEIVISDENIDIIYMNDAAIQNHKKRGGAELIGKSLLDCHNAESQTELHRMYSRYRAGDLYPTRHREKTGNGLWKSAIFIPVVVKGRFQGVAELMWTERADLVFEE